MQGILEVIYLDVRINAILQVQQQAASRQDNLLQCNL